MTGVHQTRFGGQGNCFGACIATIFGVPLDESPGCHGMGWQMRLGEFLAARGLIYCEVPRGNLTRAAMDSPPAEARVLGWQPLMYGEWPLAILCGPSPRGPWDHAVVGRTNGYGYTILHDPHPEGGGIADVTAIGLFVPINPNERGER